MWLQHVFLNVYVVHNSQLIKIHQEKKIKKYNKSEMLQKRQNRIQKDF